MMYILFSNFKDGHYKVESSTSGYETTMKLVIRSVRAQDYGLFRCIATNSLGETDGKITLYSEYTFLNSSHHVTIHIIVGQYK